MFILVSFAGKISSEESSTYIHPEVEGLSGPGCNQEGEERPVSSRLSLVPQRGWSQGPGSFLPLCKRPQKSLWEESWRGNKLQREAKRNGRPLQFSQLRKENRCCREKDHLIHENTCFNNFSFNSWSDKLSLSCTLGLTFHVGSAGGE